MDDLPVELITAIALLACTDGGPTGCALSRVSRRIRGATHPVRFHTVSLASDPDRLLKFLHTYTAQRNRVPEFIPRVRHLFLSLLPPDGEPMYRYPAVPMLQVVRAYNDHFALLSHLGETYGNAVCSLIRTLACDLESFTFVRGEWRNVPSVTCTFPRLRELTLVDGPPEFWHLLDCTTPRFPSLEKLHTVEYLYGRPIDFAAWAVDAPALTHLRCSGLQHCTSPTVDSLRAISAPLDNEPPAFPQLRHILVQPSSKYSHTADTLREALVACATKARPGIRFAVLPSYDPLAQTPRPSCADKDKHANVGDMYVKETAPERCIRRAREEWIARIEGGVGCWSEEYVF